MTPPRWRRVGVPHGWRSVVLLVVLVGAGLAWIGWPLWDSLTAPDRAQAQAEAPWLMAALVCGLFALAVALWLDAGRRLDALAVLASLIVANTVVRSVLSPSANGVELVHALPLLAGMAAGAPAGFLVGAGSALLSTIAVGEPAATLPTQALVWGLSGMLGGLLWRMRPRAAWLASLPLALLAGLGSGVLLNLMGWGQEPGTTLTSFFRGLPPSEAAARLWSYTLETSLVYDLTRGVTTALVLAVVGHPLLVALRRGAGSDAVPVPVVPREAIEPYSIDRREDRSRLDRLWNEGDRP
ncbi:hypothetical protein KVF89_25425 [Nocardioides carbamazepini]|uniref:hypothetical protein n=1 Tax=Nocardioides carbamazepini TaxID=2854259 RepID=UPI002149FF1B|nr:hypothetical protein [Nocardioides carbamazepini]MCR1785901.1 hypothetical protein [Nocardioides carbamazepini]